MKNNMKLTDYYKSGKHKENVLKARTKAAEATALNKQQRIDTYNKNPSLCKCCSTSLEYKKRHNQFCSKSCAATYNNTGRIRTEESKQKTGKSVSLAYSLLSDEEKKNINKNIPRQKFSKIEWHTCKVCEKIFYTKTWSSPRITCGEVECKTHASVGIRPYTNGRRKIFYYFNKTENKEVLLESSWELDLAIWLDENNIPWVRPSPIKWFDSIKNKNRLYYPDFFLTEKGIYLDPKNPTALKIDQNKMEEVSKIIPILYGDLNTIKRELI
jgi:hypothetical protein